MYPEETECVAKTLGVFPASLETANVAKDADDVLRENLRRLIGSLGPSGQKRLAQGLGFDPTTVSRWYRGKHKPNPTNLGKLRGGFGLPEGTDLRTEPLYTSTDPVGEAEQKAWLHEQINRLDADALRELFPALERLLRER